MVPAIREWYGMSHLTEYFKREILFFGYTSTEANN